MEMSIWIAKLLGPVILATAAAMVIRPQTMNEFAEDFLRSRSLIFASGVPVLLGGLAIVNTHNRWTLDWSLIVTLFGWVMMISGVSRIVAPTAMIKVGRSIVGRPLATRIAGAVWALIGALLTFQAYA